MNANINILLVEDDKICEFVFKDTLSAFFSGYSVNVDAVRTGRDAIELLTEYDYDALVLDLKLPDINGEDVLIYKNTLPKFDAVPCYVVTAYTEKDILEGVIALGAKSYYTKPVNYFDLLNEIISPFYKNHIEKS